MGLDGMMIPEADAILEVLKARYGSSLPQSMSHKVAAVQQQATAATNLPAGWTMHKDEAQRVYYHHAELGSQWSLPEASLPSGWSKHVSPEGKDYFHHPEHGTQWQAPSA